MNVTRPLPALLSKRTSWRPTSSLSTTTYKNTAAAHNLSLVLCALSTRLWEDKSCGELPAAVTQFKSQMETVSDICQEPVAGCAAAKTGNCADWTLAQHRQFCEQGHS